jgi:hypothetical protein
MILTQGKLADGLVEDILEAIHKYDDSLYMSTVIGVLELVKHFLIQESIQEAEDD